VCRGRRCLPLLGFDLLQIANGIHHAIDTFEQLCSCFDLFCQLIQRSWLGGKYFEKVMINGYAYGHAIVCLQIALRTVQLRARPHIVPESAMVRITGPKTALRVVNCYFEGVEGFANLPLKSVFSSSSSGSSAHCLLSKNKGSLGGRSFGS
jgi:hypothetical protein